LGAIWIAYHDSTVTVIGSGFNFAHGDYIDGSFLDGQVLTGFLAEGDGHQQSAAYL